MGRGIDVTCGIEPVQDLHGYSYPWPAGGGKNKASLTDPALTTNTQQTIATFDLTGTFSMVLSVDLVNVNFTTGSSAIFNLLGDNGNNYIIGTQLYRVSDNAGINTLTRPVTGRFYCKWENVVDPTEIKTYFMSDSYGKWSGQMKNVQVEFGTSATAFEPYSNICPISGSTSMTVTRAGKNILPNVYSSGSSLTTRGITYTNTNGIIKVVGTPTGNAYYNLFTNTDGERLHLKAGTYTISCQEVTANCRFNFTIVGVVSSTLNASRHSYTFTLSSDGEMYANVWTDGSSAVDLTLRIMLELGSTPTNYEPYTSNSYIIQLGQTVYGGTLDVTNGTLTIDRAIQDIGDRWWTYDSNANRFSVTFNDALAVAGWNQNDIRCSCYQTAQVASNSGPDMAVGIWNKTVYIRDSNYTTTADLRTARAGQKIVYELSTPQTYQLTPQDIEALFADNNVWCDTGNTTVTYYANTKLYIDKKIAEALGN